MPFKLKLKKRSRQYNVTSKNLFVISVEHLLDSSACVDCTLDSESTGKECLANVCQRLSINQPEFFGLRYIMKENTTESRWIDLERPLNRQLEKYAASQRLSLRVMYYVECGVSLIRDEVTRYYYFLQVKSDVVEGRIHCDPQQAVILAIYARQAESDILQKDKHTIDYLKTMLPFPKRLIEEGLSEKLTEEVLQQNCELNNLTQSAAEELYILTCQQLEGYGQERFPAKDDSGHEVFLVLYVWGITVSGATQTKVYRWRDITNVVNLKRNFNIECTVPENSVGFTMPDGEMGRYFWRLCVLQHLFYASNEKNMVAGGSQSGGAVSNMSLFQSSRSESVMDSRENLLIEQAANNWRASDQQLSGNKWQSADFVVNNVPLTTSQQTIDSSWATSTQMPSTQNSNWGLAPFAGSNASLSNRAQSSSCLDLTNNNTNGLSVTSQERHDEKLAAYRQLLPTYRQAPDYETAIQQKYRPSSSEMRLNNNVIQVPSGLLSDGHINATGPIYSGSQPDVHRAALTADMIFGAQLQQHYPDVTQTTNPMYSGGGAHMVDSPGVYGMDSMTQRFRMMKLNKPPPPYPANRLSSTSTPDLAVASHRALMGYRGAYVSGSSPDLVSSRTFLTNPYNQATYLKSHAAVINPGYYHMASGGGTVRLRHSQSYLPHGTYENLNYLEGNGAAKPPPPIPSNNIYYCLQQHEMEQLLKQQNGSNQILHNTPSIGHQMNGGGSVEPIYENVPLPWQKEATPVRERASSVTSGVKQGEYPPTIDPLVIKDNKSFVDESHKMDLSPHLPLSKTTSNPISSASVYTNSAVNQVDNSSSDLSNNHFRKDLPGSGSGKRVTENTDESSPKTFLNRSHSTNLLDSSQSSNYTVATTDSGISAGSKEKRKKRWGILSRSKNSLDKQKSATLGREKSKSKNTLSKDEEDNIKHRWSTGLPRLQPLSANISKEKLCQILEDKLNDEELFIEFERIPKRKDNAKYECALHDENKMKNLDPNFLPHDDNRVRLVPSMNNRMGYVNASHVTATVGSKQRFYIVAQSPFNTVTADIFWKCVWEADVYLLVQLSAEIQYVPTCSDKCLEYGQYQVWREFSQETDRCITSKLRIYHTQSKRYRSVWHIYYSEWNELNTPKSVGHFLDFLEELNSVRMASVNEIPPGHNTNPPVLIHCSEGGGRSGVTLAADLLLFTLDHNQDLDIPRVVGQMRHQRDNIVPALTQYKFIYAVLIHYLKRTRLI